MREIKFRAWDKVKGVMLQPAYIGEHGRPFWNITGEYACISFPLEHGDYLFNHQLPDYEIYKLMQYTGLKDKNGVDIYEGDIYRWRGYRVENGKQVRPENVTVVTFDPEGLYKVYCLASVGNVEVIGNIHEHPELLEVS